MRISDLKLTDCKQSKQDSTRKYIFDLRGQEVEFSYINKGDGKDIIVCPCQTSCKMGCTFCFLTGMNLPVVNLTYANIVAGVEIVIREAELPQSDTLLVSFMGSGEPLLNYKHIINACQELRFMQADGPYDYVRFAVATMIPSSPLMREFTKAAKNLPIKLHLSLHSPFDTIRKKMMPNAVNVVPSLELLNEYSSITKNPTEIHYTLIDGFNDLEQDHKALVSLFAQTDFAVKPVIKFLDFKSRPDSDIKGSERVLEFMANLEHDGIQTEFYMPPGPDIGSSCGQFVRTLEDKACRA